MHATVDTLPLVRELQPDVVVADILTLAPALAAEIERRARARRSSPTSTRTARPTSRSTRSARACRAPPSGAPSGAAPSAPSRKGLERGRARAQRHPRAARARAARATSTAASAASSRSSPPSRSSSTRAPGPRTSHVVGPLMWEPPASDVELPGGGSSGVGATRRSCWSRPPPPRTPSTGCCAPRCAASPTRPCACSPPTTAACRRARCPCPTTRASSTGSPTRAPCPTATSSSATPATARSCARSPRGCAVVACPAVGDMNENAARLDWAGAGVRVPRRFVTPRVLRLAVERALGEPVDPGAGAGAGGVGRRARRRGRRRAARGAAGGP